MEIQFYPQFKDLTEVPHMNLCYYPKKSIQKEMYETLRDKIETEFTFWVASVEADLDYALEAGFKPVSKMNNWWPSHNGEDRPMTLMWLKLPDKKNLAVAPQRNRWYYDRHYYGGRYTPILVNLAGSGCGFKLADNPVLGRRTMKPTGFYRFFTLLRMPLKLGAIQQKWMTLNNFRLLDTGTMSTYWVNGWEPEKYDIYEEYKFFKTTREEWERHGMDGYEDRE